MTIGTSVTDGVTRHPALTAQAAATLAEISGGRLNVIFGAGSHFETMPGYEVVLWHGLIGPKGLPRAVTDKIGGEVNKALQLKETAEQLQSDGGPRPTSGVSGLGLD